MIRHTGSFLLHALTACTLVITLSGSAEIFAATKAERELIERHLIPLEGGRNFRDLGGYQTMDGRTVKSGKLFRSGVLHHMTAADYQKVQNLGIRTVVDFRAIEERESEPTNWGAGDVTMMTWNYSMDFGQDTNILAEFANPALDAAGAEALMSQMYRGMAEEQKPHYAGMFATLTSSDDPLLFHCTAGKDRTGIAAALLLTALGVDRETVIQDYVLSEVIAGLPEYQNSAPALDENMDSTYAFLANMPPAALAALMGTRRVYIESAFDAMTTQYGSVDAYIRDELGMDNARIEQLKANFLEL
ncbi:MAG: tyrosine-protein phosphatase [Pseudohongiella sp.]|nr:tyrosine-protein phosphatase [Pseudohongiella sp.]MDO9518838.1 tyrosine-protein phosphatase [Pseudohongiella sp.]MDP2128814.1 tyrosine-protein phosphatase [Pseudohongiella sp.]